MGQAIGHTLPYAAGVALSPLPIVAVVLMLATPRGHINGPMFVLGWIVGLAVAGTILLLVASGASASDDGSPSTWNSILKLLLGVGLLGLAAREWRKRPKGDAEPELPKWMKTVDRFTPAKAFGAAIALAAINPKNLVLVIGATAAIAQTGASTVDQAVALAVFVVVATIGPGLPVAISFAMGSRADRLLAEMRTWMSRENAVIMAVICVIIGAKLIGDGIGGLT